MYHVLICADNGSINDVGYLLPEEQYELSLKARSKLGVVPKGQTVRLIICRSTPFSMIALLFRFLLVGEEVTVPQLKDDDNVGFSID